MEPYCPALRSPPPSRDRDMGATPLLHLLILRRPREQHREGVDDGQDSVGSSGGGGIQCHTQWGFTEMFWM